MLSRLLHIIIALLFICCSAKAEVANDSTEFVRATLMVASPSDMTMQSAFGHAFIRMQCPSAQLDYCFSFESEQTESPLAILVGNYNIRMVCVPTKEYMQQFTEQGRSVSGCDLNITKDEGQELWKTLDETCQMDVYPYHDYFHHGCSQELCNVVLPCMNGEVSFDKVENPSGNTIFLIGLDNLPESSWIRPLCAFSGSYAATDIDQPKQNQLFLPVQLLTLLRNVTVITAEGEKPLFKPQSEKTYIEGTAQTDKGMPTYLWFWVLGFGCLVVSICEVLGIRQTFISRATDTMLIAIYSLVVLLLAGLNIFSQFDIISGFSWNIIYYNIIPLCLLMLMHWHRWTRQNQKNLFAAFALSGIIFIVAMAIAGNRFIAEQYLLVATFTIRCASKALNKKQ